MTTKIYEPGYGKSVRLVSFTVDIIASLIILFQVS